MRKILHIGLGKCGTTFFQKNVMPILEKADIASTNNLKRSYILKSIENSMYTSEEVDCADLWESSKKNNNILLSHEGLVGGDPGIWEDYFNCLVKVFPPDIEIVLTIRDPLSWMRSVYLHNIQMGNIISPFEFFVKDDITFNSFRNIKFPLTFQYTKLDFKYLFDLYNSYFYKVHILPMNLLFCPKRLNEALEMETSLSEYQIRVIKDSKKDLFSKHPTNKSYGKLAVELTFFREKLLNAFQLKSINKIDQLFLINSEKHFLNKSNKFKDMNFQDKIFKTLNYLYGNYRWRKIMQCYLPIFFKQKEYYFSDDVLELLDIDVINKSAKLFNELNREYILE